MLTGAIRSQVDRIWDAFWSGGISNPLEVIEQITYLLFIRRLDDLHTNELNTSTSLGRPMERRIFPEGLDPKNRPYDDLRWSRFRDFAPAEMFTVVDEHVFPAHFHEGAFHGFDFDSTMLRIGSMNMLLHGGRGEAHEEVPGDRPAAGEALRRLPGEAVWPAARHLLHERLRALALR